MDKIRAAELFPDIEVDAAGDKASVFGASSSGLRRLFLTMLIGISGDRDKGEDARLKAAASLVARFSPCCLDHLLPAFESVCVVTLHADTPLGEEPASGDPQQDSHATRHACR